MSRRAADRLAVLTALSQVSADLPALVALLRDADEDDAAVRLLHEAYAFSDVQATVRAPRRVELVIDGVEHRSRGRTWTTAWSAWRPWSGTRRPGRSVAGSR